MANTPTESTNIADKSTLKNWFKTGLKPLQNHFWMWLDSYWHKSESIPITSIDGLANAIDGKASSNHAHSEYATNDASSLTAENVLSWKEALDVANLQFDDEAISITQPYPAYGLNGDEWQSDYNLANYDAVQNRLEKPIVESDTTDHPFVVAVDEDGESAMIPADEFGKVDTVNLVQPDENKNITLTTDDIENVTGYLTQGDMSVLPMHWTNPSHRFSAIPDKKNDNTYQYMLGMDEAGNLGKVGIATYLKNLREATPGQINEYFTILNGSFSSGQISTNLIYPPVLNKTEDIGEVTVFGQNLFLPTDVLLSKVELYNPSNQTYYNAGFVNDDNDKVRVLFNIQELPLGEYQIRFTSGVQSHITTFTLSIVNSLYRVDLSTLEWNVVQTTNETIYNIIDEPVVDFTDTSYPNIISTGTTPKVNISHINTPLAVSLRSQNILNSTENFAIRFKTFTEFRQSKYPLSGFGLIRSVETNTLLQGNPVNQFCIMMSWYGWTGSYFRSYVRGDSYGMNYNSPNDVVIIKKNGIMYVSVNGHLRQYSDSNVSGYDLLMKTHTHSINTKIESIIKF